MGIAIAIIYLPLLVIATIICITSGFSVTKAISNNETPFLNRLLLFLFGLIVALSVTIIVACWFTISNKDEWGAVIGPLAISLTGPFVVGVMFMVVFSTKQETSTTHYITAGAFHSMVLIPVAGFLALTYFDDIFYKPSFSQLCADAKTNVTEKVAPARSIALYSAEISGAKKLLLAPNTTLEYMDIQVHEWSGKDRYDRVTAQPNETTPQKAVLIVETSPANPSNPTAEYVATSSVARIPDNLSKFVYGRRVEVHRVSDNKLIAYTQYYWSSSKKWECPTGGGFTNYSEDFIARVLNLPT